MDLLDELVPQWHFGNKHHVVVAAAPDDVAAALESFRLDRDASPFVRFFFRARGLSIPTGPSPREALTAEGFSVLAERPGREIVFGVAGKFWAPREMAHLMRVPDAETFKRFAEPGQAKGAIGFRIEPRAHGGAILETETRVWCTDRRARLLFAAYWTLISIPSGIIRRDMLRAIARRASRTAATVAAR